LKLPEIFTEHKMHDSCSNIPMSRRKTGYMQMVNTVLTKGREFDSSAHSSVGHVLAWREGHMQFGIVSYALQCNSR